MSSLSRSLRLSLGLSLWVAPWLGGCIVSFDGYEYDPSADGSLGGASPDASTGGIGAAGVGGSLGGAAGSGGAAFGGSAGAGGSLGGAAGSAATGGTGGTGGSTGGTGGSTGGTGGSTGGTGGSTGGTGGSSGGSGGSTGGTGGSTGGTGGGTGGAATTCPTIAATAVMREVPKPGGGIYCVDATEVTQAQYSAFLFGMPSTAGQPAGCGSNSTFTPSNCGQPFEPTNKGTHPVFCVDWCDAHKYCEVVGKRLCGDLDGGAVAATSRTDPARSQWHRACTMAGTRDYPYGPLYDSKACNGLENDFVLTRPAGSLSTCQGGYANVFDMSGNVREWENACSGSDCAERGGGYLDGQAGMRCDSPNMVNRMSVHKERGFRCCLDP